MSLDPRALQRYARQILLPPIAGPGQRRILAGSILLHGEAPLCAIYLAAAGLGHLAVTGRAPDLAARDPGFRLQEGVPPDAAVDLVLDLGDGTAFRAASRPGLWGAAMGRRVLLGCHPAGGLEADPLARPVLETLAAGEALRRLVGLEPCTYDFEV